MRVPRYFVVIGLFVVAFVSACGGTAQVSGPSPAEQEVARVGEEAAQALIKQLVGQLTTALEQQGPVQAFEFCTLQAQPLTATVQQELGSELQVKRTSLQWRNPVNAPDAYEVQALLYFQNALAQQGTLPANYVQQISANEFRYYKPMVMADWCLSCHGDPATFDPALQQKLQASYPGDLAVGYAEGDFRGVVRVTVPIGNEGP